MYFSVKQNFLLVLIVLFSHVFSTISYGDNLVKGVVLANNVNVRSEANSDSSIIETLDLGEYIDIVDNSKEWFEIKLVNGSLGWIYGNLIVPANSDTQINRWIVNAENVNVRANPNLDSTVITKLKKGYLIRVIDASNDWLKILMDDSSFGWIHSDFAVKQPCYAYGEITGNNVNLRTAPSLNGDVIKQLNLGDHVSIKNYLDGWFRIIINNNIEGWVYQDYVKVFVEQGFNFLDVSRSSNRSVMQVKIVDFAKKYIGTPYKWAGNGPNSFDCSGYTTYVFKHFGVALPRRSRDQGKTGDKVPENNLLAGDLVFFDTSGLNDGNITHVGIYIGDGEFIHASSGKNTHKVTISSLKEGFYKEKFVLGRRVF